MFSAVVPAILDQDAVRRPQVDGVVFGKCK